jgi:tRNA modification GTPase
VNRPAILVKNKSDLSKAPTSRNISETWGTPVLTSAVTGEGIDQLRAEILRHVGGEDGSQAEFGFLTNVRHQGLIQDSLLAMDAAKTAVAGKIPHEMLLIDLYGSLRPLDAITGATTTEDILNLIFSTFCIGK